MRWPNANAIRIYRSDIDTCLNNTGPKIWMDRKLIPNNLLIMQITWAMKQLFGYIIEKKRYAKSFTPGPHWIIYGNFLTNITNVWFWIKFRICVCVYWRLEAFSPRVESGDRKSPIILANKPSLEVCKLCLLEEYCDTFPNEQFFTVDIIKSVFYQEKKHIQVFTNWNLWLGL